MAKIKSIFILCCFFAYSYSTFSQSSGTSLLEFQYGKLPGELSDDFASLYNRTTLSYRQSGFKASATLEQFYSEFSERNYTSFAQGLLQYKNKKWEVNLGNMYETLGRGLLLRSFEIKGAVIQDLGFRSRQYFHRDMLGASVQYKTKKISIQAMRADVLNTQPPILKRVDRRTDLITSLALKANYYKKHKAGLYLLNHENTRNVSNSFSSLALEGPLPGSFNYYFEFANGLNQTDRRAVYGGVTGLIGPIAVNFELKSYTDFILGSGINEPPAGVQQQNYRVLNRSTHVSNPINEDGYQIDLSYGFENGGLLVFNHALARNSFGNSTFTFRQFFIEWSSQLNSKIDYKIFADWSEDPLKDESQRLSLGLYTTIGLSKKWRLVPEIELQRFDRTAGAVNNQSFLLGLRYKTKLTISALIESTTDPFLINTNVERRNYIGFNIGFKPNYKNSILLFAGERRGGPACSSGVCYEILDFKGFECRWTTRF